MKTEIEEINEALLEAYKLVEKLVEKKNELMRIGFRLHEKKCNYKSCQCKPKNKSK